MVKSDLTIVASAAATKKFAEYMVKKAKSIKSDHARVIALSGNLGAGKTTFVQGFARALGINVPVQSPTFVLMKIYLIGEKKHYKHLVHIDTYRIKNSQELNHLGFQELLRDKDAVILIEWADKVKNILPDNTTWIRFQHGKHINERIIQVVERRV